MNENHKEVIWNRITTIEKWLVFKEKQQIKLLEMVILFKMPQKDCKWKRSFVNLCSINKFDLVGSFTTKVDLFFKR